MIARPNMPAVAAMLADRMPMLAHDLFGKPDDRDGNTWRYGRKGSLAVVVTGPKRGGWFDHEAGEGGDALALIGRQRGMRPRDAWEWAMAWLGIGQATGTPRQPLRPAPLPERQDAAPTRQQADNSGKVRFARDLWHAAKPAAGTLVETYLASRGLVLEPDAPIRFLAACPRGRGADLERLPAMVALMTCPTTGQPRGIHRTFLAPDGNGKAPGQAKMMLGHAGVIRLVPNCDLTDRLGLAEGIEDALAVMQRGGWRPVWAATSAGAITCFPVLRGINALAVFADADKAGLKAARTCCRRWAGAGRKAELFIPPNGDWDDALRRAGKAA
ncbi:DUF7146 domain-containing protein [Humitalea sp. 24SJ18S-53]|uniref:DUF7146 domain-containing protein n=1 Tax=Humitalea sp. 24SJ18S-53 TaxID=3422307 RepID=UPI003D670AD0